MTKVLTLLVVSDEAIPSLSLNRLLSSEPDFRVVAEAEHKHALQRATSLKPDVVLFHNPEPRPGLAATITSIRRVIPRAGLVVLGRETHPSLLGSLLAAGASGYVLLRGTPRDLFGAIHAASRGHRFLDPYLSEELIGLLLQQATTGEKPLSRREQQVLRMIAYGHSVKEIAATLNVSRKSVETYQERIREKRHLRTRADFVRYALETGLLSPDTSKEVG